MPTVKQLSRIFSADDSLNRLQDQLAAALNPILRNVQGDLTGPLESPSVVGLQGRSLSAVGPTTGQAIVWNGTQWAPGTVGSIVTSVLPPLVLSSGVLSIPQADATTDGYLSAADWVSFNGKVSSVTATSPLASSGGSTPDISLTGVVAAANGGTGLSSPGAIGNVLTSTGTGWTSSTVTASPTGPAGGVLGYTGSTYPDPNGLSASVFTVPGEGYIRIRYGADSLGNLVTTFFQMDSTAVTATNVSRSVGVRGGTAGAGLFGVNIRGGDVTIQGGVGSSLISGGSGGNAYFYGGNGGTGTWAGGSAIVQAGNGCSGGGNGGQTEVNGGFAASGATRGGHTYVRGGSAPGGVNGGSVFVQGGSNQFQNATGGDVTVQGGDGITDGSVRIGETTTEAVFVAESAIKTHVQGPVVWTPPAIQTITGAGDSFTPDRTFIMFDITGGNHTLTSTPTIATANAVEGQMVILMNVDATDHINLQRGATYALSLSNATAKIDPGGSMMLVFDGTYWVEIAHTVATSI